MPKFFQKQPAGRIIALGFLSVILIGSVLLILPCSVKDGVEISYIDALYTSTSAVCVTGLVVVDAGDTFTVFGQIILGLLIQIGGLGVTSVGTGIIIAMGKKVDLKGRNLIKESLNVDSGKGLVGFIKDIFITTIVFELVGAVLCFPVFAKDFSPLKAAGVSLFHSVAAFNNSGFDILGNFQNLIPYQDSVALNLITCVLIFFGGIGFLVIREMWISKGRWRKLSMHSKVVISMSVFLIAAGTLLLKLTEDISWMGAFFHSVSARTAGFSTYPLSAFTKSGLLVIILLMFIGASPGSTGGGIKTSTFFVLLQGIKSASSNKSEKAFNYAIPKNAFRKASVILILALGVVFTGTFLLTLFEPDIPLSDIMFEVTSAFGTVGLSTGISPDLGIASKFICIIIMYIGRLGPLTVASLWYFGEKERVSYPDGNIAIG